jgi:hypothetical protein
MPVNIPEPQNKQALGDYIRLTVGDYIRLTERF